MLSSKSPRARRISVICFLALELILALLVQTSSGALNIAVSFASVVVCCAFCILLFTKSRDYTFTQLALVFTVLADLFLVVFEAQDRLTAMICFSLTQIFYLLRLHSHIKTSQHAKIHLALRGAVVALALIAVIVVLGDATDPLSLVSLFYYANLWVNIVVAFIQMKRSPLFAIGLLLFLMCDTVIGLNVMAELYIPSFSESGLYAVLNPGFNLAWAFYVPSQTIITLSLIESHIKSTRDKAALTF